MRKSKADEATDECFIQILYVVFEMELVFVVISLLHLFEYGL